jgi:hypothetical protein
MQSSVVMNRRAFLSLSASITLSTRASRGSLFVATPSRVLLKMATFVPQAIVTACEPRWSKGRIETIVSLKTEDVVYGPSLSSFQLALPGGTLAGVTMKMMGWPTARVGDRSLILAAQAPSQPQFGLIGAGVGYMPIVRSNDVTQVLVRSPGGEVSLVPHARFVIVLRDALVEAHQMP